MGNERNNNSFPDLESVYQALEENVPSRFKIEVKKEKPATKKVSEYNKDIIETYLKGEDTHLKQQKPVGIIIAIAVGLQLIAFNVLIFTIVLQNYDIETLRILLDFMKYYTGAVIIEMLGMCWLVVKGVYSVSIGKMVEHILKKNK